MIGDHWRQDFLLSFDPPSRFVSRSVRRSDLMLLWRIGKLKAGYGRASFRIFLLTAFETARPRPAIDSTPAASKARRTAMSFVVVIDVFSSPAIICRLHPNDYCYNLDNWVRFA
jgi:hypothetical protein